MKKNKMMRTASVLAVAVLLTTCAISGTFAKYVTSDSVNDHARVAKFGVVVTADGTLFSNTYKDAPETTDAIITVKSDNGDKVVAPGTNNGADTFKFSITGQPEVDVKVEVKVEFPEAGTEKDVFLKQATGLPDMTTGDDDTFNLAQDYYPVKYSLTKNGTAVVTDGKLSELATALQAISVEKVDANTNLGTEFGDYEITWKWDYDGVDTNDKADTLLGGLAAGNNPTSLEEGTAFNLKTGFKLTITVTQLN